MNRKGDKCFNRSDDLRHPPASLCSFLPFFAETRFDSVRLWTREIRNRERNNSNNNKKTREALLNDSDAFTQNKKIDRHVPSASCKRGMDGSDNALLALSRKVDLIWITGLHAYAYTGPSLSGSLFGENTLYVWEWDQVKESRAQRDQEEQEEEEESQKCSNQSSILSSTSSSSSYSIQKRGPLILWFPFWRIYLFLFFIYLAASMLMGALWLYGGGGDGAQQKGAQMMAVAGRETFLRRVRLALAHKKKSACRR